LVAVAAAGCRRRRGTGFPGLALIANYDSSSVAAVDLTSFTLAGRLQLSARPSEIVSNPAGRRAWILAASPGTVYEIDAVELSVRRRVRPAPALISLRLDPKHPWLWVLVPDPPQLLKLKRDPLQVEAKLHLPAPGSCMEISPDGTRAAVAHDTSGEITFCDLENLRQIATLKSGRRAGPLVFRQDGKVLLAGDPERETVAVLDGGGRSLITTLKLAVRPEHFCFKPDGGELFVTGQGMDAVVIINPYRGEVAETVLAGRAPAAMACSSNPLFLFVANPPTGDVTILDPETRRVAAVATVGLEPHFISLTPDDSYALILNRRSGTLAVLRPGGIVMSRARGAALFTSIPVGPNPVAAAVVRT